MVWSVKTVRTGFRFPVQGRRRSKKKKDMKARGLRSKVTEGRIEMVMREILRKRTIRFGGLSNRGGERPKPS